MSDLESGHLVGGCPPGGELSALLGVTDLALTPGMTRQVVQHLAAGLTLGNAEVDADPESDRRSFYERERGSVWSAHLADSLDQLKTISVVESAAETDSEAAA